MFQTPILTVVLAFLLFLPGRLGRSIYLPMIMTSRASSTLLNPGFECGDGYHNQYRINGMVPDGWTASVLAGSDAFINSTQMWATMSCDPSDMGWEKLEGHDSNIFLAAWAPFGQDFPAPPFDLVLYQSITVTPGTPYSLSVWMTSLCGGSMTPSDCPQGAYIAKMAGIDPMGENNPSARSIIWTEDRRPHTEARWANLAVAATARSSNLTVFVRANSPFQHHGNHVFADAVKLVRAPSSRVTNVEADGSMIGVVWAGELGPDILAIPAGNYQLLFEVQVRAGTGPWQNWLTNQEAGKAMFAAPLACDDRTTYSFRVRSTAEQIPGQKGAWPNHRFVGVWTESVPVPLTHQPDCSPTS